MACTGWAVTLPHVNVIAMLDTAAAPGRVPAALGDDLLARTLPTAPPHTTTLWPALVLVALVYLLPSARRWGRAVTTVVHEAGHATAGVLTGRRFHGFVVERNLAGSAVTSGRSHGPARIMTTWAGYPAPAVLGAVMVGAALSGWSGPLLVVVLLALVVLLVMSRSMRTIGLVVLIGALTAALWWWGDALGTMALRAGLVAGAGMVLLVGAWDSLADVARSRDGAQDHRTLTELTRVPSALWLASWFLVDAAATALVGWWVWTGLP